MEGQIKEWLENCRPVRQWTVRGETTKDKAGALPPAVYVVHNTVNESEEKFRFPEESMYHQRLQYHNVIIAGICGQRGCY